jgi:hypothetical protein
MLKERTQVRLKPRWRVAQNLHFPVATWLAPDLHRTHGRPSGKSAVCGLNGLRAHFVVALSLGTYGHAIWKSRSFTALFSWTSGPGS